MMKNKWTLTRRIIFVIIVVGAAGFGYGAAWHTFVQWWEPLLWSFGFAAALTPVCKKSFSQFITINNKWLCIIVTALSLWALSYGTLMNVNYFCADDDSESPHTAVVISKHSEERTRYRRSGRRGHTIPAGTYNVYYVTVRFENGALRELPASASEYVKARRGDTKQFLLKKGFFGYTVFKKAKESK